MPKWIMLGIIAVGIMLGIIAVGGSISYLMFPPSSPDAPATFDDLEREMDEQLNDLWRTGSICCVDQACVLHREGQRPCTKLLMCLGLIETI